MTPAWMAAATIARDIATAIAALVAASVAIKGLNAWRSQLHGQAEYDLARRLLRAAYRLRDELQGVRNPLILASEFEAARQEAGIERQEGARSPSADEEVAVYDRRWKRVVSAMSDLQVETIEAEVIWGRAAADTLVPLRQCVAEMYANLMLFFRQKERGLGGPPTNIEARERVEQVVWKISGDPAQDAFTGKIVDAVAQVENLARPHLNRRWHA